MSTPEQRPRADLSALRIHRKDEIVHEGPSRLRFLVWVIVVGSIAAAGWFLYGRFVAPRFRPVVETVTVRPSVQAANAPTLSATGYLVADRRAEITPKIAGRVVKLNFDTGSRVEEGQVLAVLDASQFDAQLREVEASLAEARREYNRQLALWNEGVTSRSLLDSAKASLDVALARRQQVQVALADNVIRAPFDGTVISRNTELGEVVSPFNTNPGTGATSGGGSIATIADLGTIEVEVDVNESNVGQLRSGQPAEVSIDAFPGRKWRGRLRQIIPTADRAKGVVQVRVEILDPSDRLLPDMSSTVSFLENERTDAELREQPKIWIPEPALITTGTAPRVALVSAEGLITLRNVSTGERRDGRVEITGGLSEGDVIVARDAAALEEGQTVKNEG